MQDAESAVAMAPWQGMYTVVLAVVLVDGAAAAALLAAVALRLTVAAAVTCCLVVTLLGMLACLFAVWLAPDEVRVSPPGHLHRTQHTARHSVYRELCDCRRPVATCAFEASMTAAG